MARDFEHDADAQGMLLMARAGYHPDYVFALHHMLRIDSGEQSKFAAFFSDHPRWQTRDQRSDRAYAEAVSEYNARWPNPANSPGGMPPAVAFLGDVHGIENKQIGTGDLAISVSCRNVVGPVAINVHLMNENRQPIPSSVAEYRDATGNLSIHAYAPCLDNDLAAPTVVHIPTQLIPERDRKLKAQVDLYGADSELLESSNLFDVHFPKAVQKGNAETGRVWVGDSPPADPEQPGTSQAGPLVAVKAKPVQGLISVVSGDRAPSMGLVTAPPSQALTGTLSVTSDPTSAEIFLDSKGIGSTPRIVNVSPGIHSVQVVRTGQKDWTTTFEIKPGTVLNLDARMER